MRLGVLGGTFDPVHMGHLILAEIAREELDLDRVLFVPSGQPWRKGTRDIAPASDRIAMLRLATAGNSTFDISTIEVEREGPSYTEVTLEELRKRQPDAELFFIMGRDALADFPNWHNPQRVADLAALVVADRDGAWGASETEPALPGLVARLIWLRMPRLGISASGIRARVREGNSVRYQIPDSVGAFIEERGLYRAH